MAHIGGAKRPRQAGARRVSSDRPLDLKAMRSKAAWDLQSAPQAKRMRGARRPAPAVDLERMSRRELLAHIADLRAEALQEDAAPQKDAVPQESPAVAEPAQPASLCVPTSVRSGQIIVCDGDVTVIGSVSSGAEIIAGGSIHVYGSLRGRAIAGNAGNAKARIFCRSFDAELLAIDGSYRVAENLDPKLRGKPVQAWLDGAGMTVTSLD